MDERLHKLPGRGRTRYPLGIASKIWLSLSILILGYSASMVFGSWTGGETQSRLRDVSDRFFPAAKESQRALTAFKRQISLYADAVATGEVDLIGEGTSQSGIAQKSLCGLTRRLPPHSAERRTAQELLAQLQEFTTAASPLYRRLAAEAGDEDLESAVSELAAQYQGIDLALMGLESSLASYLRNELAEVSEANQRQVQYNLIVFCFVVGISTFLVSLIIHRSIIGPLRRTAEFAGTMADGDLSQKLEIAQKDEIGELARAINVMATEIEKSQTDLEQQVRERTAELKLTHQKLVTVARRAGMAEVASAVLHNVGNVLNSVNITTGALRSRAEDSRVGNLARLAGLLEEHTEDLAAFLTEDSRGEKIAPYLTTLSEHLGSERDERLEMLESLSNHIKHITTIITRQQQHSGASEVLEEVELDQVLEAAIDISTSGSLGDGMAVVRDFHEDLPALMLDRHKMLQILVNLLTNAKHAVQESSREDKVVRVAVELRDQKSVSVTVSDNGVGISDENMKMLFTHGFTTKQNGHGFGLHSAGLAAKEMRGTLTAASEGEGRGAQFSFTFPLERAEAAHV